MTTPQPSRHARSSGHVVVDLDAARLVDDGVVGERAEHAHHPEVLTLGVVAGRPVDLPAEPMSGAEVAQVLVAGRAARAATARRDEPEHDVIAGGQPADPLADLLDDAGALVAADDRQLERQVTGDEVLVRVAHPRGRQLDQHLARAGRVELDLLHAPRRADLPQDRSLRLHRIPLVVDVAARKPTLAQPSGGVGGREHGVDLGAPVVVLGRSALLP